MSKVVDILIPMYNSEKSIVNCINSLLAQTYQDINIVVVDDGSTDQSCSAVLDIGSDKVSLYRLNVNSGISLALNHGLSMCTGEFIARMDSDDTCSVDRIEKQINFLKKYPEIDVVGSYQNLLYLDRIELNRPPLLNFAIKSKILTGPVMLHPTVMFRKSAFKLDELYYDKEFFLCEDYELWSRLISCHKFANIPESLCDYNWKAAKSWETNENKSLNFSLNRIWVRELRKLRVAPTDYNLKLHKILSNRIDVVSIFDLIQLLPYVLYLCYKNYVSDNVPSKYFVKDRFVEYKIILKKFIRGLLW